MGATVRPSPTFGEVAETTYWHALDDGRVQCDVCPRACRLHEGQRGLCFVRAREHDQIVSTTYGRSSGYCIDPIEKKPLNHFLPGTPVLSFGTAGCNLTCKFCQNWDISKSRDIDTLADAATPEAIADAARRLDCTSVAFTYNDPVVFLEYAVDTARACREAGIRTVGVTAGYVEPGPREELFNAMDAVNIDLKGFTQDFYHKLCGGNLESVLQTIDWAVNESPVWVELTTLLIPEQNDSDDDLHRMADWVVERLGSDVPWHFSAFHPDWKMMDVAPTPPETLRKARAIAMEHGARFVYTGNVHDPEGDTTFCPACHAPVIVRDWYDLLSYDLDASGACGKCGAAIPGVFAATAGSWGRRRMPVTMTNPRRVF